jgi:hypothetical protein
MAYFRDAGEVYECIGRAFRLGGADPTVGHTLRGAHITLQLSHSDPLAELTVRLGEPYEVIDGGKDETADLKVSMPGDIAHLYWRGEYDLAVGLAEGQVEVRGPISKILKLVPITASLFPLYRQITDDRDRASTLGRRL